MLINYEDTDLHVESVRCLRTELHHNLGFADSDLITRTVAENWRRKACRTSLPKTHEQWKNCCLRIIDESDIFLGSIDKIVRRIESDGVEAQQYIDEWLRCLRKNWAASAFDPLIDDIKYRLSMNALNTVTFRNRYLDRWRKCLDVLEDDFDFEFEATRLIEKTLLAEENVLLPITGKDLIENLGVKPGPVIGLLLREARRYLETHSCSRDELLAHLSEYNNHLQENGIYTL